jgi:hypothetical protein
VFAHTTVEAPKNGAINRAAAISAPNVDNPTTNTNTSNGGSGREGRIRSQYARRPYRSSTPSPLRL